MKGNVVRRAVLAAAVLPALACGLEKVDSDSGGADGVPPGVQQRFTDYCALSGCHDGAIAPNLQAGASDAIIGMASTAGSPYVEFGNLESHIVVRINDLAAPMPPASSAKQPSPEDLAIIVGWIAGVAFDDTDGGSTTGMDTDMSSSTTTAASTTFNPSTTGDMTTGDTMDEPTYANVQMIFDVSCATMSCHDGTSPPDLTAANARASTVGVPSPSAPALTLITAGDSANSYLWHKISGTQMDVGGLGSMMPIGPALSQAQIDLIAAWIDMGAEL